MIWNSSARIIADGDSLKKILRRCASEDDPNDGDDDDEVPDYRGGRRGGPRGAKNSYICQTQFQWCRMPVAGPPGTPCWCSTPMGNSNGLVIPESR